MLAMSTGDLWKLNPTRTMTDRAPAYPLLDFERQADPSGEWITMAVRMKLDLAGLKIDLAQWQSLTAEERDELHSLPVETLGQIEAFASVLRRALQAASCGEARTLPPDQCAALESWSEPGPMPPIVRQVCSEVGLELDWSCLDRFARFVFWHLAKKAKRGPVAAELRGAFEQLVSV